MNPSLAAGYNPCDLAGARNASQFMPAVACEVSWHWEVAPKHEQLKSWWLPQMWVALAQRPMPS